MSSSASTIGTLYVVATPIGNIDDISVRARNVLSSVEIVAAEDTRHTGKLLSRLGINARLMSCHEHNEAGRIEQLLAVLQSGKDVALVSDAGTPLISDPGFRIVGAAAQAGVVVSPVPGCNAAIAAVSVAGLPTDSILFAGFLPSTAGKRKTALEALRARKETIVLYESVHRIRALLNDVVTICGVDRPVVAARELTKLHETVYRGAAEEVLRQLEADPGANKGEYVVVLGGAPQESVSDAEMDRVLGVLLGHLGVRQSAEAVAKILGVSKRAAYQRALQLREGSDESY